MPVPNPDHHNSEIEEEHKDEMMDVVQEINTSPQKEEILKDKYFTKLPHRTQSMQVENKPQNSLLIQSEPQN